MGPSRLILFLAIIPIWQSALAGGQYISIGAGHRSSDALLTGGKLDTSFLQASYGLIKNKYDFGISVQYLDVETATASESGIGDTYLSLAYRHHLKSKKDSFLRFAAAYKAPTADEDKGLGTGKADYGFFVSYRFPKDRLKWTFTGGYIIYGEPSGINFNDTWVYSALVSRRFGRRHASIGIQGGQQALQTGDDPLEVIGDFFFPLKAKQFFRLTYSLGISDASPNFGFSVSIVKWF